MELGNSTAIAIQEHGEEAIVVKQMFQSLKKLND
ncbi:hypothetical protein ACVW18_004661 [Bacillus thuringiensis]